MNIYEMIFQIVVFPGIFFMIIMGLLLEGVNRILVARMQRRVGPPLLQPLYDGIKLFGKDNLINKNNNRGVFLVAPIIGLVFVCMIPCFIPIFKHNFISSTSDIIVIIYLLTIPALAMIIGGAASSSPIAAIGGSREMVASIAYELPLILSILAVCKVAGSGLTQGVTFSLADIEMYQGQWGALIQNWMLIPAAIAFFMIIPAKVGTLPFDIAEAETEICEGPLVEYSGVYLWLYKLTQGIKLFIMVSLFCVLFLGGKGFNTGNLFMDLIINTAVILILSFVIMFFSVTVLKGIMGRVKSNQMFKFFWTIPTILALISFLIVTCIGI